MVYKFFLAYYLKVSSKSTELFLRKRYRNNNYLKVRFDLDIFDNETWFGRNLILKGQILIYQPKELSMKDFRSLWAPNWKGQSLFLTSNERLCYFKHNLFKKFLKILNCSWDIWKKNIVGVVPLFTYRGR